MAFTVVEGEFLAAVIESMLYGFSLLMAGVTFWILIAKRVTLHVHRVMFTAAAVLLILSTMRVIFDIVHAYQGFTQSGDPVTFFNDLSGYTFKNVVYVLQTLIADSILIYRCYVVWQSYRIIIIPCILWCGTAATAVVTVWSISQIPSGPGALFKGSVRSVVAFYSMTLATTFISTSLLAFKLWKVHAAVAQFKTSTLMPVIVIVLECGALYTCALVVMIVDYGSRDNSVYLVTDITGQIISITFYLIIIRAGLSRIASERGPGSSRLSHISTGSSPTHGSRRSQPSVTVNIETLTSPRYRKNSVDDGAAPDAETGMRQSKCDTKGGGCESVNSE